MTYGCVARRQIPPPHHCWDWLTASSPSDHQPANIHRLTDWHGWRGFWTTNLLAIGQTAQSSSDDNDCTELWEWSLHAQIVHEGPGLGSSRSSPVCVSVVLTLHHVTRSSSNNNRGWPPPFSQREAAPWISCVYVLPCDSEKSAALFGGRLLCFGFQTWWQNFEGPADPFSWCNWYWAAFIVAALGLCLHATVL